MRKPGGLWCCLLSWVFIQSNSISAVFQPKVWFLFRRTLKHEPLSLLLATPVLAPSFLWWKLGGFGLQAFCFDFTFVDLSQVKRCSVCCFWCVCESVLKEVFLFLKKKIKIKRCLPASNYPHAFGGKPCCGRCSYSDNSSFCRCIGSWSGLLWDISNKVSVPVLLFWAFEFRKTAFAHCNDPADRRFRYYQLWPQPSEDGSHER